MPQQIAKFDCDLLWPCLPLRPTCFGEVTLCQWNQWQRQIGTEWMGLMPRLWQSHQHCGFDGGDTAKRNHSWLMLTGHLKCPSVMPGPRQKRDKWWPQSWNSERDRRRVLTQWYVMYLAHHVPWTSISNDEMCHCALQRERETDRERLTERERYRLVFVLLCLCQACYGIFTVLLYQLQGSDCDGMCVCVCARAHYVYIKHRYARSSLHIMLQQAPYECDASWTLIVPWPVSHATCNTEARHVAGPPGRVKEQMHNLCIIW